MYGFVPVTGTCAAHDPRVHDESDVTFERRKRKKPLNTVDLTVVYEKKIRPGVSGT